MKNKLIIGTLCAVVLLGAGCNRYEKNPTLGTLPSLAREYSDKEMQLREDDNYDEKQQKLAAKYNKKMQCEWESIQHNPIAFRCGDGLPYKVDSVVIKEVGLYVFSISVYMEITKVLKRQLGEWEAGDISSFYCAVYNADNECIGLSQHSYTDEFGDPKFTLGQHIVAEQLICTRLCEGFERFEFVNAETYKQLDKQYSKSFKY